MLRILLLTCLAFSVTMPPALAGTGQIGPDLTSARLRSG